MSTTPTPARTVAIEINGQRITATGATYTAAIKQLKIIIKGAQHATQGTGQATATPAHSNQPDTDSTSTANADTTVNSEHAVTIP